MEYFFNKCIFFFPNQLFLERYFSNQHILVVYLFRRICPLSQAGKGMVDVNLGKEAININVSALS